VSLRFGTDGVRGIAGVELTPELVLALGRAAARVLCGGELASRVDQSSGAAARPSFLVGRDTRWSGPLLQAAFSAGLAAEGVDVIDLGVLPTPGVAAVAAERGAPAAVISASHNPFVDNGIKLLSAGGRKLGDAEEALVEAALASDGVQDRSSRATESETAEPATAAVQAPAGDHLGRLIADPTAREWYCDRVIGTLEGRRLGGIPVVIDCANGAATTTAERILSGAGAEVVAVLAAEPDGTNINAGSGSTDPSLLAEVVMAHRAAAGLAFDGDADRVIAVDDAGRIVDGDHLLALFATDLHSRGRLAGEAVVVTVMTNLGFHHAMAAARIAVHQTPVGDRHVLEALDAHGWSLGGEQSGHIIFRDIATTGDGVLSGLLLLDLLVRRQALLSDLAAGAMRRLPQVLRNVAVQRQDDLAGAEPVWEELRAVEADLGGRGRVVLRPSGTERLVRVMAEAPTEEEATAAVERLAQAVVAALGAAG
jgi:phosphoglucosamine mutase